MITDQESAAIENCDSAEELTALLVSWTGEISNPYVATYLKAAFERAVMVGRLQEFRW